MSEPQLELSNDELLSTTRAVRKRLDFDRDVPMSAIKECMELAVQAPSGSNAQGWQFMFVTDPEKREKIGEYYRQSFSLYREMPFAIHKLNADGSDEALSSSQERSASSADYLAENMAKAPVLMIPALKGASTTPMALTRARRQARWDRSFQRLEFYACSSGARLRNSMDHPALGA